MDTPDDSTLTLVLVDKPWVERMGFKICQGLKNASKTLLKHFKPLLYQDAWDAVVIELSADASDWLAQPLRGKGENPADSKDLTVPTRHNSAVVYFDTTACVSQTGSTRTYLGRLDVPGRWMPVSVIEFGLGMDIGDPDLALYDLFMSLTHPQITPVLGCAQLPGLVTLVMPEPAGTDVRTYLRNNPNVDKLRLITHVAEGLDYLHNEAFLTYGQLEPRSVLVRNRGDVVLARPRLANVASQRPELWSRFYGSDDHWQGWRPQGGLLEPQFYGSDDYQQALPYEAPELVLARDSQRKRVPKTTHSDMYAFGMIVYEILSGREPWPDATLLDIFRCIVSGQLLPRPEDGTIDDSMRNLCTACWNRIPADRPGSANVLAGLRSDTPPTHWGPDAVVAEDRWLRFERPPHEDHERHATPAEIEVEIRGSLVKIILENQKTRRGASGTVMRGYTYVEGVVTPYAVKVCRGKNIMQREHEIWKSLSHDNILPLLAIADTNLPGSRERIFVSPYLAEGTLAEYLESNKLVNRLPLMIGVATGLEYLHNIKGIVHGDIKPENILITKDRMGEMAVLADFGLSTYVKPRRHETLLDIRQVYTLAYCAPEILDDTAEYPSAPGFIRSKTKMSDMFAYGVLLYHAYAGGLGRSREDRIRLMVDMYDGRFPPRPVGREPALCDDMWSICTRCWAKTPSLRPVIATVLEELTELRLSPERQEIETVET